MKLFIFIVGIVIGTVTTQFIIKRRKQKKFGKIHIPFTKTTKENLDELIDP